MKKLGVVLGVAAIATFAGCKDPDYGGRGRTAGNEVTTIDSTPDATPAVVTPSPIVVKDEPKCKCAPGTKHTEPCNCGAPDCQCIVEPPAPVVPATTTYIVQRGDTLSKISKRFNIKIAAIRAANPGMKGDVVRLGQKLQLPGQVEVGEQKVPAGAVQGGKPPRSPYAPYTGETKEYVVKGGDTLGAIAYGNGINIRQLKELNGLTSDSIRVGQKLKIPAAKPAKVAAAVPAVAPAVPAVQPVPAAADEVKTPDVQTPEVEPKADDTLAELQAAEQPVADGEYTSYIVQEGDDIMNVCVAFGLTPAQVMEPNGLKDGDTLKVGQVLRIPVEK